MKIRLNSFASSSIGSFCFDPVSFLAHQGCDALKTPVVIPCRHHNGFHFPAQAHMLNNPALSNSDGDEKKCRDICICVPLQILALISNYPFPCWSSFNPRLWLFLSLFGYYRDTRNVSSVHFKCKPIHRQRLCSFSVLQSLAFTAVVSASLIPSGRIADIYVGFPGLRCWDCLACNDGSRCRLLSELDRARCLSSLARACSCCVFVCWFDTVGKYVSPRRTRGYDILNLRVDGAARFLHWDDEKERIRESIEVSVASRPGEAEFSR